MTLSLISPIIHFSACLAFSSHELEKIHMQDHRAWIGLMKNPESLKLAECKAEELKLQSGKQHKQTDWSSEE